LLVAIFARQLDIVGMLHPAPKTEFAYRVMSGVPFLRVPWPITDGRIETEWVISNPSPLAPHHVKVCLDESELSPG
jgi:hypothetical protein